MSVLRGCARCGGEHRIAAIVLEAGDVLPDAFTVAGARAAEAANAGVIVWRRLTRPVADPAGEFTHWAPCPTNGEPILARGVRASEPEPPATGAVSLPSAADLKPDPWAPAGPPATSGEDWER